MADAFLHDVDPRKVAFPFQKIGYFRSGQVDLDAARRKPVVLPVIEIHRFDDFLFRHFRVRRTEFIKNLLQLFGQCQSFRTIGFPFVSCVAIILLEGDIQRLDRRGVG
ncbi:hypothetical protein D3C81_1151310 [compost metagenome]